VDKKNTHFYFLEAAAETEPAWTGSGQSVGLRIWRIMVSVIPVLFQ